MWLLLFFVFAHSDNILLLLLLAVDCFKEQFLNQFCIWGKFSFKVKLSSQVKMPLKAV